MKKSLISVEEALELLVAHVSNKNVIEIELSKALDYVLAEDVYSPINMPPFPQSAMDGYAVNYIENKNDYQLVGEIAAGSSGLEFILKPGECVRIFTGAPVPLSANTVVKQEIVKKINNSTILVEESVRLNENIREVGGQINKGELALLKGTVITPSAIGFLLGLGITNVAVYSKPSIAIIATGSELVKPGNELEYGKIYESNSYMFSAALTQYGFGKHSIQFVEDDFSKTKSEIEKALKNNDVLILSGGISVGDYDFVEKALKELGVKEVFYKVKQKPGKPLFFGVIDDKYVLALPGNPAAAMTSFYIYVLNLLNRLSGKQEGLKCVQKEISSEFSTNSDRAQFLKAKTEGDVVEILDGQSSAMLRSFAVSNSIVYLPEGRNTLKKGEKVGVYVI